jgi:deazaflavin-dependent oxidoreductase (nitroreductase family)
MSDETVLDSPTDFVAEHVRRYLASDGADGYDWRGAPTLLLTTRGRRTGALRRTALIFGRDGDDFLIVASKGGAPENPLWYENLLAEPRVRVQLKDEQFEATARPAGPEERSRLWAIMTDIWPDYDEYTTRTERVIPIVVLSRL